MKDWLKYTICTMCFSLFLTMLFTHRGLIAAVLKGEPLPEAPEGCPAHKES